MSITRQQHNKPIRIDKNLVLAKQKQKRQDKGGFTKKLRLLWTE